MFLKNQIHYKYFKSTDNSDNGYSFQTWTAEFHTCQGIHIRFPTDPVFQSIQFQKADTPINKTDLSMACHFLNHFSFSLKVQWGFSKQLWVWLYGTAPCHNNEGFTLSITDRLNICFKRFFVNHVKKFIMYPHVCCEL